MNQEHMSVGDWMDLALALLDRKDRRGDKFPLNFLDTGVGMFTIADPALDVESEFPTLIIVDRNTEWGCNEDNELTTELNELIKRACGGTWPPVR